MNTFKRKTLHAAVLVGLGAMGLAGSASAVHVNPDGLGQVLIYPYYTAREGATTIAAGQYNTYVSVTNTTTLPKAVKVRFIEGKNSREVLDFNLFLSPKDVWTGAVLPRSATAADGAKLVSFDKSCTYGNVAATGATGVPFSNAAYSNIGASNNADGETTSLDRTNEGYIEIMEMGVITHAGLATTVTHVNGVATCSASVLETADAAGLVGYLSAPTGGLFGGATLINTATGVDYAYDAVALDNWDATVGGLGSASTSTNPSIAAGSVTTSDVFMGGAVRSAQWTNSLDAVSASIMRNTAMNEYVMDTATASNTDWVVTFPTKRFHVVRVAKAPFTEAFTTGGSCDAVSVDARYDREEQFPVTVPGTGGFSPISDPLVIGAELCWESNVITFGHDGESHPAGTASKVLGSTNSYLVSVPAAYENGWMSLGFTSTAAATTGMVPVSTTPATTASTYTGLPVVGFMVQDFTNSTIVTGPGAAAGAAHGGNFAHKYTRNITVTP